MSAERPLKVPALRRKEIKEEQQSKMKDRVENSSREKDRLGRYKSGSNKGRGCQTEGRPSKSGKADGKGIRRDRTKKGITGQKVDFVVRYAEQKCTEKGRG